MLPSIIASERYRRQAADRPCKSSSQLPDGSAAGLARVAWPLVTVVGSGMKAFHFPDLGEGLHEAQVVEWHVAEGDEVAADDPLLSVETDKAVTEVPAPWKGRIAKLCAAVGDTIHVGDEVVRYEGEELAQPATATMQRKRAVPAEAPAQPSASARRVRAMPAVRILAAELGLDLAGIAGSGPDGTVLARDLAGALRRGRSGATELPSSVPEHADDAGWQPLSGVRRSMARNMERSRAEVAPATVHEEADVSAWVPGSDVTARLVRAILAGIAAEPALNGWFDGARGRKLQKELHLGVAVDIADGLVVPVLRDAGALDAGLLRSALNRLIEGARQRTLAPGDLVGATMTLTNYGMIAGLHATPVVIPPQIAILGSGRIGDRLRSGVDGPRVARILPLSLSYDHRCVTGGEAARFLRAVIASLETAD
jgi:2-oxoisovalerate dehydrogenase E2 component (dihydrolipoyl transacylase)